MIPRDNSETKRQSRLLHNCRISVGFFNSIGWYSPGSMIDNLVNDPANKKMINTKCTG
jgi:hypothetical protein